MKVRLLNLLIPGDSDFPSAEAVGLASALAGHERFSSALDAVASFLPSGFAQASHDDAIEMLKGVEATEAAAFSALIVGAYSLYYTDPKVADVIERLTGHTAKAPQPTGHALEPFDPALIAVPAARAPSYRPTPETE